MPTCQRTGPDTFDVTLSATDATRICADLAAYPVTNDNMHIVDVAHTDPLDAWEASEASKTMRDRAYLVATNNHVALGHLLLGPAGRGGRMNVTTEQVHAMMGATQRLAHQPGAGQGPQWLFYMQLTAVLAAHL